MREQMRQQSLSMSSASLPKVKGEEEIQEELLEEEKEEEVIAAPNPSVDNINPLDNIKPLVDNKPKHSPEKEPTESIIPKSSPKGPASKLTRKKSNTASTLGVSGVIGAVGAGINSMFQFEWEI